MLSTSESERINGACRNTVKELPITNPQLKPKDLRYVSGYIFPFHFTHPVTGKPTSEAKLNARLKPIALG
jgi:hypothetical protein